MTRLSEMSPAQLRAHLLALADRDGRTAMHLGGVMYAVPSVSHPGQVRVVQLDPLSGYAVACSALDDEIENGEDQCPGWLKGVCLHGALSERLHAQLHRPPDLAPQLEASVEQAKAERAEPDAPIDDCDRILIDTLDLSAVIISQEPWRNQAGQRLKPGVEVVNVDFQIPPVVQLCTRGPEPDEPNDFGSPHPARETDEDRIIAKALKHWLEVRKRGLAELVGSGKYSAPAAARRLGIPEAALPGILAEPQHAGWVEEFKSPPTGRDAFAKPHRRKSAA